MEIIIKGQPALIKAGSSFEFVSENRFFTGSDSYTLNIEFPLAGCPQNLEIFGHLNRTDVATQQVVFDCEIRSGSFYKSGIVTVTEMTETFVKTQFLEGRSALNFKSTFDDIYINELYVPYPSSVKVSAYNGLPYDMQGDEQAEADVYTADVEHDCYVALPWVNNNSGNVQNDIIPNYYGALKKNCTEYSFMPYLVYLTEEILRDLRYNYDLSEWQNSKYSRLLCCNALPAAWEIHSFARALPHWTVTEYFEQLEKILPGEFEIDHKKMFVRFRFSSEIVNNLPSVSLEHVVDEFTVERTEEDESEYKFSTNTKYSDCDHRMWKFYSCHWALAQKKNNIVEYSSRTAMNNALTGYKRFYNTDSRPLLDKIFYCRNIDTYFVLEIVSRTKRSGKWEYQTHLQPINQFGAVITDKKSEDYNELGIVPVWFDETDYGPVIFLECNDYDEKLDEDTDITDEDYLSTRQSATVTMLDEGEQDGKAEYFDKIYFAYWQQTRIEQNKYLRPITDYITMKSNGWDVYTFNDCNFRLSQNMGIQENDSLYVNSCQIDNLKKYTFKFLAHTLPNPRSIFFINGGKYVCKKLTATFTESGMSQLVKGEFYKIL